MTPVFLTIDTELAWRHHAAGLPLEEICARSIEPAGVGLTYQLDLLARHALRACFFVDPMPAMVYGLDPFRRIVGQIRAAGQEVQLHCHPCWTGARPSDRGAGHARFNLSEYGLDEQRALLSGARDLLVAAGSPAPVAFRAGGYAANDDTLAALGAIGIEYDSSFNAAWPYGIAAPGSGNAPWAAGDAPIECPVTVIDGGGGAPRPFQICALSRGEAAAALDHAAGEGHAAVTIVGHSFELATRLGTRANSIHVARFEALCARLAERREVLPTMHYADRPTLRLDGGDRPLPPSQPRAAWRKAEQLWSNWVVERAA